MPPLRKRIFFNWLPKSKFYQFFRQENLYACLICFSQLPIKNFITLSCNHRFCSECLISEWELKISQGQVSNIKCPSEKCENEVNYYILKGNLRKAVFEKYDQLLYNFGLYSNEKPEKNNEKAIICPSCSSEYFIPKETQYFTCHKCQIPYCSNERCLGEWKKHQGKTCEEFVKEKKQRERTLTPSFLNSNNLKQCPVCGSIIEKFGNCNLVRCCSVRCQKKTLFCFVCLEVLSEKNSLQHFSQNSSFGKCNNIKKDEIIGKNNMEKKENNFYKID